MYIITKDKLYNFNVTLAEGLGLKNELKFVVKSTLSYISSYVTSMFLKFENFNPLAHEIT